MLVSHRSSKRPKNGKISRPSETLAMIPPRTNIKIRFSDIVHSIPDLTSASTNGVRDDGGTDGDDSSLSSFLDETTSPKKLERSTSFNGKLRHLGVGLMMFSPPPTTGTLPATSSPYFFADDTESEATPFLTAIKRAELYLANFANTGTAGAASTPAMDEDYSHSGLPKQSTSGSPKIVELRDSFEYETSQQLFEESMKQPTELVSECPTGTEEKPVDSALGCSPNSKISQLLDSLDSCVSPPKYKTKNMVSRSHSAHVLGPNRVSLKKRLLRRLSERKAPETRQAENSSNLMDVQPGNQVQPFSPPLAASNNSVQTDENPENPRDNQHRLDRPDSDSGHRSASPTTFLQEVRRVKDKSLGSPPDLTDPCLIVKKAKSSKKRATDRRRTNAKTSTATPKLDLSISSPILSTEIGIPSESSPDYAPVSSSRKRHTDFSAPLPPPTTFLSTAKCKLGRKITVFGNRQSRFFRSIGRALRRTKRCTSGTASSLEELRYL